MKKKESIRICGARARRLYRRFVIFLGMTALYSSVMAFDAFSGPWIMGWVLLLGGAAGLIFGFFKTRDKRRDERERQIDSEAAERYPEATFREYEAAFIRFRRKELRLEALLYLLFAAASLGWAVLMYRSDADPTAVCFGGGIVTGALLLIAFGLLIASFEFTNRRKANPYPEDAPFLPESRRKMLLERSARPDRRSNLCLAEIVPVPRKDQPADAKTYCAYARAGLHGYHFVSWLAFGFFVLFPLVPFVFVLILSIQSGSFNWLLLFFGVVSAFSVSIWFYMEYLTDAMTVFPFRLLYWLIRTRTGACCVFQDRILSVIGYEDREKMQEICFDRAGTFWVRWRGTVSELRALGIEPGFRVTLVETGRRYLAVIVETNGENAEHETARTAEPTGDGEAIPQNILTDAAFREEVQRRLSSMDPKERRKTENEIREYLGLSDLYVQKTLNGAHLSRGQEAEYWSAHMRHVNRLRMDTELDGIEAQIMKKLSVSRETIAGMKKNPYAASTLLALILTAVVGIGGILGTALIEKRTGAELGFVYILFSAATGALALTFGNRLMNLLRFRKLQRAYRKPAFMEKKIKAAVYGKIYDAIVKQRERERS